MRLLIPFRARWGLFHGGRTTQQATFYGGELPVDDADAAMRPPFDGLAKDRRGNRDGSFPVLDGGMADMQLGGGLPKGQAPGGPVPSKFGSRVTTHRPVTVTPITTGSTPKGGGGQISDADSADLVEEPTPWLLVFAYLGDRFRRENQKGTALEKIGAPMGVSKQHLLKLTKGGTVGLDIFWRIAEYLFDGSVDNMVAAARRWWNMRPPVERAEYIAWSARVAEDRTKAKRPGKAADDAQEAELERLQNLRPAPAPRHHSIRIPTAVTAVGNKSLSAKKPSRK